MSDTVIVSGGVESGLVIGIGTALIVESGGTVVDATILAGGEIIVQNGGLASETTFGPGGTGLVTSGGVISDSLVESAGRLTVSSGGTDITTIISSGGTMLAAGSVNRGIVMQAGASVTETVYVSAGEVLSGAAVGSGLIVDVASGGTLLSADIRSSGYVEVGSGGVLSGAVIESQGHAADSGGTVIATDVAGGQLDVVSGAAIDTQVGSGGILFLSNSVNSETTVESGGFIISVTGLASGQTLSGPTLGANESLIVSGGASVSDITLLSGGTLIVSSGGSATDTRVSAGAYEDVYGASENALVAGSLTLFSPDGVLDGATIVGGGFVRANAGNIVSDVTIAGSGVLYDYGLISGTVTFADHGSLVVYSNTISTTISGFSDGNSIDLQQLAYVSGGFAVAEPGKLVVEEGSQTAVIPMAGDYTGATFTVSQDNTNGGTVITVSNVPCFVAGTLIETEHSAKPVEALAVGEKLRTLDGSLAPIIWIGQRMIDLRRHPAADEVRPVMIAAHAFEDGVPCRPLLLSPDHAIWADDVLIPVKHLVNGTSIRPQAAEIVTYFHIELPQHDVIFAAGLAVESYLDTGDRKAFDGRGSVIALHPVFGRERTDAMLISEALAYAPLRVSGPEVKQLRARLAARARLGIPRPLADRA